MSILTESKNATDKPQHENMKNGLSKGKKTTT